MIRLTERQYARIARDRYLGPRRPQRRVTAVTSPLALRFEVLWRELGGPPLVTEHRFDHKRRWRADYAHLATRTIIELEGGIYRRGRHNRPSGYRDDIIKYNAATMQGWAVLRLATGQVNAQAVAGFIDYIRGRSVDFHA